MYFTTSTKRKDVLQAMNIVNFLIAEGTVAKIIENMTDLDIRYISNFDPVEIAGHTTTVNFSSKIKIYRPWHPFSKAYAKTTKGKWKFMKLNSKKLYRHKDKLLRLASISGTIIHEGGHNLESYVRHFFGDHIRFDHGDNKRAGKENTFQYRLGREVKHLIENNYPEIMARMERANGLI